MAKEKKKDLFLKGRKRSLESKKPEPCQFCQIQVQGFSERLEHESKCKKRPNRGNFAAAGGAEAAGAAARGVAAGGAAANDPNQVNPIGRAARRVANAIARAAGRVARRAAA